jgi:hypothetical protein
MLEMCRERTSRPTTTLSSPDTHEVSSIVLYCSNTFHSAIYKIPVDMTRHGSYPGSAFRYPAQIPIVTLGLHREQFVACTR